MKLWLSGIILAAMLAPGASVADDRTLFERNSRVLRDAQRDGRVQGPDRNSVPHDQRVGGGGLGGGPTGGNRQGGPNVDAINVPNQ